MSRAGLVILLCLAAPACGGASDEDTPQSAPAESVSQAAAPSVTIVSPAEGAFQEEREVEVFLRTTVPLAAAGDLTPGTGHHHLFLDADVGDPTAPIETVPGSIVHLGDGSDSYLFEDVGSGPHRLIAVVADGAHVPLQPLVTDTVHFVVE
ncbi:MAG: DUF4399 domain-containing protein [Gemmatimonadota bacterium]|jgi:hypothetical protein